MIQRILLFALRHYNRSKQASDLRFARVLNRFEEIQSKAVSDDRGANLQDVLKSFKGAKSEFRYKIEGNFITYVLQNSDGEGKVTVPVHEDKLSGLRYFFAVLPIEVVHHDERINPRPIGSNVRGLIEEFHKGRPQLHIALAWIGPIDANSSKVHVFDGQHKAAAQILLGSRNLPVRIFVDPDFDLASNSEYQRGYNAPPSCVR